jgi:hypothetical protein
MNNKIQIQSEDKNKYHLIIIHENKDSQLTVNLVFIQDLCQVFSALSFERLELIR